MAEIDVFDGEKEGPVQFKVDTNVTLVYQDKAACGAIRKKAKKLATKSGMEYDDAFNLLLGRAAVKGWAHINKKNHPGLIFNNKPFPFTEDNRDFLMRKSIDFSSFVNANVVDPDSFREEEEEKEEAKND